MINRILALRLFEGFPIQNRTDRIRPIELNAMDMHSLKAVLTFFIGKLEELKGLNVDWNYIIEGIVFGLLNNITLSDIKAPVISKIKKDSFQKLIYYRQARSILIFNGLSNPVCSIYF